MNRRTIFRVLLTVAILLAPWLRAAVASADSPVVHAVLFYSQSCPHCHEVIVEDLPPLFEKYGDKLLIAGVDVGNPLGSTLFDAAGEKFGIPPEQRGVPFLVIADVVLIGSLDIPEQLPGLIEKYLAEGGVDWPAIPGLKEAMAQAEAAQQTPPPAPSPLPTPLTGAEALAAPTLVPTVAPATVAPTRTLTPTPGLIMATGASGGYRERFDRDPTGNGLAVIILAAMVAALAWVVAQRPWRVWATAGAWPLQRPGHPAAWAVPLLSAVGLAVAGYLAYVETQQVTAVCGPVGDCNSVQQSPYARLFGLIPIGVLGVAGYLAILAAWAVARFGRGRISQWACILTFAAAAGGTAFSIYLTFLEPFVIGATCAWCLSSAVIMTSLLLLMAPRRASPHPADPSLPARQAEASLETAGE